MAWLAALGGGGGAGALGSTAAGTAATAGAAEAAGAGGASAGSVGDALMGGTTAPTTTPASTTPSGGLLGWWNSQPKEYRDVITNSAISNGFNALTTPRPLPSPTPMTPTAMTMPSPLSPAQPVSGQSGGDMSAYAPFLQALARGQANRFGASPFGFGVPGAYFQ